MGGQGGGRGRVGVWGEGGGGGGARAALNNNEAVVCTLTVEFKKAGQGKTHSRMYCLIDWHGKTNK